MNDSRPTVLVVDLGMTVFGGIERVMLNVLPLINRRWRVVYCDLWSNSEYARDLEGAGVEVLHLLPESRQKYIGKRGSLLRRVLLAAKAPRLAVALLKLRRWIGRHRPTVIYFNRLEVIRVALPFIPGDLPCIYHSHGFPSIADVPSRAVKQLNSRFYRTAAVSQRTLELLADAGVRRQKLTCVYNAVDAEEIRALAKAPGPPLPDRPAGEVIFLHVAVIAPHKGQDIAIEALGRIPRGIARLWICGDLHSEAHKEYKEALEGRVGELNLKDRVSFLGWRTDVPRVMAAADVVILPSRSDAESFGMALIEGMALARPCIGTTRGGVPEVIADGRTGLIREPTPEAFAEAMGMLAASSELREKMGRESARRVEDLFTLARQAAGLADILDEARAWKAGRDD